MTTAYMTVTFEVDWDKNGVYTDESAYVKTLNVRRGRAGLLNASGPEPMTAGECWGTLSNVTRRFDPYYSSGALYGYLKPGRPARVKVTRSGTTYYVFSGYLMDVRPYGQEKKEAYFQAKDGFIILEAQNCDSAATQTNYKVSSAITDLLAMSDLSASTIDDNGDLIDSFTPNPENSILAEIQQIADAWMGTVFMDTEGSLFYRARNTARVTALSLTNASVRPEVETRAPWQDVYNDIRITPYENSTANISTNSTSISDVYRRTMQISSNAYIQTAAHASGLGDYLILYAPELKRGFKLQMTRNFANQFSVDLTDRVSANLTAIGANALYSIGAIEHEFREAGNCITTLTLEPDYYEIAGLDTFPLTFPWTFTW